MTNPSITTRATMIGCGGMARHHLRKILPHFEQTHFTVVCEPSETAFAKTAKLFEEHGRKPPSNQPDLDKLLTAYGEQLDTAFIITPHKFHCEHAIACLEAGLDVLLEKPMVMTADEAQSLIETRHRSGKLLVVAFQGSLSPEVRMAKKMLDSGIIGTIRTINGQVWQNWSQLSDGTWRQDPDLAGGGFMFDTGAHLLNTVSDLAGGPFVEVAAWLENLGRPVDVMGVVIGRLQSGALVTLNACGDAFTSCHSEVRIVGTKGMLRTGIWGRFLDVKYRGEDDWSPIPTPPSLGVWEQFLAVRAGKIDNPAPPKIGLRMAHLWDAIKASAAQGGQPVQTGDLPR